MKDLSFMHQKYLVSTYPFRGKTFIKGNGAYLYDEQGNQYLDLVSNYGVNIFGHCHPHLTHALQNQINTLPVLHCSFANDIRAQAAHQLVSRCGGKLSQVYFSNSGAEAIEAALKFSILATGNKRIIATKGAYHGKTLGALSVTASQKYRSQFEPLLWDVKFINFGDIKTLEQTINKQTTAVILEPIQGESGVIFPPKNYLKKVRKLCNENNTLLILDEIQTGMGRTGTFLACHQTNVEPDIVCLGKGLAGGTAVGVTLVTQKIANHIPKAIHTSTFGGNPLVCAGILATLNLLTKKQLQANICLGNYFLEKLHSLKNSRIKEIRGQGLMIGIEVTGDRNQILKALQVQNIIAAPANDQVVRFLPPYIITKNQIDHVTNIFNKALKAKS